MRLLAIAAALSVLPAFAAQVDLDQPGTLDRLKVERPRQYEAVAEVLRASERMPCKEGEMRVLKAKYDLREMSCNAILMTSYPSTRRAMPAKGEGR